MQSTMQQTKVLVLVTGKYQFTFLWKTKKQKVPFANKLGGRVFLIQRSGKIPHQYIEW